MMFHTQSAQSADLFHQELVFFRTGEKWRSCLYTWKKFITIIFQITINKYLCLHFSEMYDFSLSTQDNTQSQEYT